MLSARSLPRPAARIARPMSELLVLAAGAAVAGFVQGISGFAFSMVALSIWAWSIEPTLATAMAVCGGLSGQLFSAVTVRRGLHLPVLWPFLAGGALGIPIGVLALPHLDPARFKLVLGIVLLACCTGMLFARRLPSVARFGRAGDVIAGALGGAMGGLGGITGAAPAMWCTLRGFERDAQRAVVQNFNLLALTATLVALLASGTVRVDMLGGLLVVVPALLLPSWIGSRVYLGLDAARFRQVVLVVVALAGAAMIAASFRAT
jgi:uncharacterized membrane protein YfcA